MKKRLNFGRFWYLRFCLPIQTVIIVIVEIEIQVIQVVQIIFAVFRLPADPKDQQVAIG